MTHRKGLMNSESVRRANLHQLHHHAGREERGDRAVHLPPIEVYQEHVPDTGELHVHVERALPGHQSRASQMHPKATMRPPKRRRQSEPCTHVSLSRMQLYLSRDWLETDEPSISRVECFPNRFQEPYLMVKREYQFIWFNTEFRNYGCNKVQMIEHLRYTSGE